MTMSPTRVEQQREQRDGRSDRASGPSSAEPGAIRSIRGVLVALLVGALLIGTPVARHSTAGLTYPFLEALPPRAPAILYMPSYYPGDTQPLRLVFGPKGAGFDFEMRQMLPSGGQLIIWESTRYDATVQEAVGAYQDDAKIPGALAAWTVAHAVGSGAAFIHARIGQTLIVISGSLSEADLLRVADSLRQGSPQSLML